eukprot:1184144-Prorocentrum_minimum.AAC.2
MRPIEQSGADTERLKALLAQLVGFVSHTKLAELVHKIAEHAPVDKAKALVSEGLAKLPVQQLRARVAEALAH